MGVFNFIETFFFISLGITFVLILLLVYHFKQRLNSIEQKSDTMFEIINNIVTELTSVKQYCMQPRPNMFGSNATQPMIQRVNLPTIPEFVPVVPTSQYGVQSINRSENVDVESASETDDDSASETDSESESDDESDDESILSDDSNTNNDKKIIVSDDELSVNPVQSNTKIIILDLGSGSNVDNTIIGTSVDLLVQSEEISLILDKADNIDEQEELDVVVDEVSSVIAADATVESMADADVIVDNSVKVIADFPTEKENLMSIYNKMSSNELKAVVIQKGLNTEPSKMKRPRLLQLLEKSL